MDKLKSIRFFYDDHVDGLILNRYLVHNYTY